MDDKIYPNLSRIDGSAQRYAVSKEMRDSLEKRATERKKVYKRYSKACSILQNSMISLAALAAAESVAGITTSLILIGLPVGVILTGLGVATGVVSAILSPIVKHLNAKKVKHARKHATLTTGVTTLNTRMSRNYNDGIISEEEFRIFTEEYNAIMDDLNGQKVDKEAIKKEVAAELMNKFKNA